MVDRGEELLPRAFDGRTVARPRAGTGDEEPMRMELRWTGRCVGAVLAMVGCGAPIALAQVVEHDVIYASPGVPGNERRLDLFRPSNNVYSGDGFTVVLMHSGGYSGGDKSEMWPIAGALANLGYAVVTPSYTLATSTAPSFPQVVSDAMNLLRWIRTEGLTRGIPDRVVLAGHSAGATIALTAAGAAHSPLAANFPSLPPSDRRGVVVDGAIGLYGRYDLVWNAQLTLPTSIGWYVGSRVGDPGWQAAYAAASATHYVTACSPPTVLIHGDADNTVPSGNLYQLADALVAAGVPTRQQVIAGGGHELRLIGPTPEAQAQWLAQAVVWISAVTQSTCGRVAPSSALASCCYPDGTCAITTAGTCTGEWSQGTYCAPSPCAPAGVCCFQMNCAILTSRNCVEGQWRGPGVCVPSTCQNFFDLGPCCRGATCSITLPSACVGANAAFTGSSNLCNASGDHISPCRHADFNKDGVVGVQDVFSFLDRWFARSPDADITGNGLGVPSVQSIFTFIAAWFNG